VVALEQAFHLLRRLAQRLPAQVERCLDARLDREEALQQTLRGAAVEHGIDLNDLVDPLQQLGQLGCTQVL